MMEFKWKQTSKQQTAKQAVQIHHSPNFIEKFEATCEAKGIRITTARKSAMVSPSSNTKYLASYHSNPSYTLPREKALALALATQPRSLEEIQSLLSYAGYSLSKSILIDRIVVKAVKNQRFGWTWVTAELDESLSK